MRALIEKGFIHNFLHFREKKKQNYKIADEQLCTGQKRVTYQELLYFIFFKVASKRTSEPSS